MPCIGSLIRCLLAPRWFIPVYSSCALTDQYYYMYTISVDKKFFNHTFYNTKSVQKYSRLIANILGLFLFAVFFICCMLNQIHCNVYSSLLAYSFPFYEILQFVTDLICEISFDEFHPRCFIYIAKYSLTWLVPIYSTCASLDQYWLMRK